MEPTRGDSLITFSEAVLHGRTPAASARLRFSFARLFTSDVLAHVAREYSLSPRQAQVLVLTLKGLSMPRIAEAIGIKLGTAKIHREQVRRKMHVENVTQMIMKAIFTTGILLSDEDREILANDPKADRVAWRRITHKPYEHKEMGDGEE